MDPVAMISPGQPPQGDLVLRPAKIVDGQGNVETVYVQQQPCQPQGNHAMVHRKLMTWYLGIGIIALSIGIYSAIRQHANNK